MYSKTSENKIVDLTSSQIIQPQDSKELRLLLKLSALIFFIGVVLPIITTSKFFVLKDSYSILSGAYHLISNEKLIAFTVVVGFGIALPIMKFIMLWKITSSTYPTNKIIFNTCLMYKYRWVDVSIVIVIIAFIELGAIKNMNANYGVYLYPASLLLIMVVLHKISVLISSFADSNSLILSSFLKNEKDQLKASASKKFKVFIMVIVAFVLIVIAIKVVLNNNQSVSSIPENHNQTRDSGDSYNECVSKGVNYYKEIDSFPKLSTGEDAESKVKGMCRRSNNQAFKSF